MAAAVALLGAGLHQTATAHAAGMFAAVPAYDSQGLAFAVFDGGTVDQLERAAQNAHASGAWAQATDGRYQLLVVGGPMFLKTSFKSAFASGFSQPVAVALVRADSAASAPAVTSTRLRPSRPSPSPPPGSRRALPTSPSTR